jgi:hypothetical protein
MPDQPNREFGARRPPAVQPPAAPVKRSRHVALLLMGTVAVGSGAYALMPPENCQPNRPGIAASPGQPNDCAPRSSSSGGGSHGYSGGSSSRSSFFGGDASPGSSSPSSSSSSSSGSSEGGVSRGGFGSFAHAFTSHFSGGG